MKAPKADPYFVEVCPFTQRRRLRKRPMILCASFSIFVFIFYVLVAGGEAETKARPHISTKPPDSTGTSYSTNSSQPYVDNPYLSNRVSSPAGHGARSYSAPQIVRRTSIQGGNPEKLPTGTTLPSKLLNTVISSDQNSPVIALILDDAYFGNALIIPAQTKAIGQAALDSASKRLQVRFHTLVFPDGNQASFSGLALMADGSSGIPGNYHSGNTENQIGRFSGNFVGGLASGLKEKQSGGWGSNPVEPGSLKNGLLNGVAESASDQAKVFADDMKSAQPYLEVLQGAQFVLYLEREFSR